MTLKGSVPCLMSQRFILISFVSEWVICVMSLLVLSNKVKMKICNIIIFLIFHMSIINLVSYTNGRTYIVTKSKIKVLRRIYFATRRHEIRWRWRKFYNEELRNFCSSSKLSVWLNQEYHVDSTCSTREGLKKYMQNFSRKNLTERYHLVHPDVDWK
jgi:hypothetical protein